MTWSGWLVFAAVSVLPAMSPGPAVLLALSNTLRFSPRATFWSALGNSSGLLVIGLAITLGLGSVMNASASLFTAVKLTGAAYLIVLGIGTWRGRGRRPDPLVASSAEGRAGHLFGEGLAVALTNPKAIVILAALLPQFLQPGSDVLLQATILSLTYSCLCFANHMLVAAFGNHVKAFLSGPRGRRLLDRALGTTFVAFGGAMATVSRPA